MTYQKRVAVLGSTGSIGIQTLDLIRRYPSRFAAHVLTARQSSDLLIRQALEFKPAAVVLTEEKAWKCVREALSGADIQVLYGSEAIKEVVQWDSVDLVLNALVGFAGLEPTLIALKIGRAHV